MPTIKSFLTVGSQDVTRVSYGPLPTEGAKNRRDISRVVNQLLIGAQNVVFDFTVPPLGLEDGEYQVLDPRVSKQKYIRLMPLNAQGVLAANDVWVSGIGNGFFNLSTFPVEDQSAHFQTGAIPGSLPGGMAVETVLPLETEFQNQNFEIDLVNNRVISLINGDVWLSFTISGEYAKTRDYIFSGVKYDNVIDQNELVRFSIRTDTDQQSGFVDASFSSISSLLVGEYIEIHGIATGGAVPFTYDLAFGGFTIQPDRGAPVTAAGELKFRALIIG